MQRFMSEVIKATMVTRCSLGDVTVRISPRMLTILAAPQNLSAVAVPKMLHSPKPRKRIQSKTRLTNEDELYVYLKMGTRVRANTASVGAFSSVMVTGLLKVL